MSGLCVTHRALPVESVRLRNPTAAEILSCADVARAGDWTAEGRARREAELSRRRSQWAVEAPQEPQTVSDATTSVLVSPADSECVSCGLEHCASHADGSEVNPSGYTPGELVIFAVGIVGLAAVAAWTMHSHGLI
jgi:hypothetical protein